MKKSIFLFIAISALISCKPGFNVKKANKDFSKNKNPEYISTGNRISTKSIAGGVHINNKGVYLNPFVELDNESKEVKRLGFNVVNKTSINSNATSNSNQLGTIKEITFKFSNGNLLNIEPISNETKVSNSTSYNSLSKNASSSMSENATLLISKKDFKKLANAKQVSCKITGAEKDVTYTEEDIKSDFLNNINKFYKEYVN